MSIPHQSLGRRKLLWGVVGGVTVGALGAWRLWPKNAVPASAEASGVPRQGGELVVAFDGAAITTFMLDPHNSLFAPHNRVMRSIYDNLTVLLPDHSVGPWLAEAWEISPDRRTYVFKLRRGVRFHDGTVFDAAAVKANFDRVADPANALYARTCLGPYVGSEVLADDRLRVTLSEPFTPFLRHLSMTKLAIVSPAAVAQYGRVVGQHPVGTGPFRFVSLTEGTEIRLERNPDYHWAPAATANQGPAYLDKLTFKNVPEEVTRVAILQSGEVLAADLVPPQAVPALRGDPAFRLHEKELLNTNYSLALNVSRPPWDDDEVRLAFRLSLDIEAIVRTIYLGVFPRAWSSLSPSMFASGEPDLADSWKSNVTLAAEILDRKGWVRGQSGAREKGGQPLKVKFIDTQGNREKRLDVMQMVRNQLSANGIALVVDSEALGAYAAKVTEGDFDLAAGAQFHSDPDVLRLSYSPKLRSPIAANKVVDDEIVDWLNRGAQEADGPGRAEWYRRVQRKILDKTYGIPIYVLIYNLATASRVQGFNIDAHGFPEFLSTWIAA